MYRRSAFLQDQWDSKPNPGRDRPGSTIGYGLAIADEATAEARALWNLSAWWLVSAIVTMLTSELC